MKLTRDNFGELLTPIHKKIIWQAYMMQGIDLDSVGDLWIAPDSFYASPWVKIIEERGALNRQ